MAANKVGCSTKKTILVDPNKFDGQSSSTNMSVPLEDLSISVQLETSRKPRTILTTTKEGKKNVASSSKGVKVRFIEGSTIGGKKVLSTKYTDLTTSFDDVDNDGESLGITAIDIDFNSSYAPLVTINFVDLRGSAIFQNEQYVSGNANKYSTFFQLPYPLYSLTIKGYYGMPVKYELHMTKFNAKFNSQTGNFEIVASFIGYTYAMLSDMLLGYLKAIPYTELGAAKYEEFRKANPNKPLLTLDDLMVKISQIDDAAKKLKATDEGVALVNQGEQAQYNLDLIKTNIVTFGQKIDYNDSLSEYKYIIHNKEKDSKQPLEDYKTSVTKAIEDYNKLTEGTVTIDPADFTDRLRQPYKGITISLLMPSEDQATETSRRNKLIDKFGSPAYSEEDFELLRSDLLNYVRRYGPDYGISLDTEFDVWDFRPQYKKLDENNTAIDKKIKDLKKSLGELLRAKAEALLGVEPTVRNIVEIFTASVEVLMSVLFRVSETAIGADKQIREKELKKFGPSNDPTKPNSYDIKFQNLAPTDGNLIAPVSPSYYPWPEYRTYDAKNGLIDTYLGDPGVLDNPSNVTELRFIDDLLRAFLTSKKREEDAIIADEKQQTNWLPVNPLDTRLFVDEFPYTRISGNRKKDIVNMIIDRAFIYLGVSNYKLTPQEIKAIAEAECEGVLKDIPNDTILDSLTQLTDSEFYNSEAKNYGDEFKMMKYLTTADQYYYNYIFGVPQPMTGWDQASVGDASTTHILPINVPSKDKFEFDFTIGNSDMVNKANNGYLFLTNYTTTPVLDNSNNKIDKPYDGGIYVKMIKPNEYDGPDAKQLPTTGGDAILDLSVLRQKQEDFNTSGWQSVGFNQFGGKYGIQEYRYLNFNTAGLEKGPFMGMFYQDSDFSEKQLVKSNTLAKKRGKDAKTDFDIDKNSNYYKACFGNLLVPVSGPFFSTKFDDIIDAVCGDDKTHEAMGKNRLLLTDYMVNKSQDITFPFISFQIGADTDDANFGDSDDSTIVGLFGSRLYYEQSDSPLQQANYAKAFLFLHTFPWNGFYKTEDGDPEGIFSTNEILNTFGNRAGFVSAPKLWAAFIGGLLWRADTSNPIKDSNGVIYSGGSGPSDPILFKNTSDSFIPTYNTSSATPTREEYITAHFDSDFQSAPMIFPSDRFYVLNNRGYKPIEQVLLQLPDQVKDEFKKVFFNFVKTTDGTKSDWERLREQLEVFSGTGSAWVNTWNSVMIDVSSGGALDSIVGTNDNIAHTYVSKSVMLANYTATHDGKPTFNDYVIFSPYISLSSTLDDSEFHYNFVTELRDESAAVQTILSLMIEEIIIMNTSYKIWQAKLTDNSFFSSSANLKPTEGVYASAEDLKLYIDTVIEKLKPTEGNTSKDKKKQREQEIFGTDNENLIKLQLYRTCKNIYDKWIGGTENEKSLIFRDGAEGRNGIDKQLAILAGRNASDLMLIDSFRFVDRAFKDIGDDFYVNPLPVNDYLKNNPNSSFYDCVTNLLSSNNFDFIPLPTYINYGDEQTLESMFQPMPSEESFNQGTVGPAFVCVYVGQTSKHLDFNSSEYENDGVTFRCDSNGNLMPTPAQDFLSAEAEPYENKVAVFAVNYSQQNQNIFKDISLDQSEFTETAESLQITDDIANRGSENRATFGGQNMYNVYSVRSYKAEVEMMGNAMIQPMMYFQLNNIPMFHGAYMITHVKHAIKPNSMSTHFSGVRIRNVATPLLEASDLFMSLLDSIEASSTASTNKKFDAAGSSTSSKNPVVGTNADYAGYVTYDVPESDSLQFQEHMNGVKARGDSYAMQECGEFMVELAKKWRAYAINTAGSDCLYINNFGAYGGGTNKKHGGDGGLHAIGLACDIKPMANVKGMQTVIVGNPVYDQAANIKFIQMAIDLHNSQDKIKIQNIILNDDAVVSNFSNVKGSQGTMVIKWPGHDNHIHIEFDRPPRVVKEVQERKKQDEQLVTSAPAGAVTSFTGKLPTESEKINALGQI